MSKEVRLKVPFSEEDINKLNLEDVVYVDGFVFTARDQAHKRAVREQQEPPSGLKKFNINVMFHTGPAVKRENGKWRVCVAGPTTANRMERWIPEMIRKFNLRGILSKGLLGGITSEACVKYGCVFLTSLGGESAAMYSSGIHPIAEAVFWMDLGAPEAVWVLRVENFGPCIVAIDARGNNLFDPITDQIKNRILQAYEKLGPAPD